MVRIASIIEESVVDGEGIRYVIFTQGCNHNCKGCHNPATHDFNGGELLDESDIIEDIVNNPLIDGITLSGGDPFFQASNLINIAKAVKEQGLTVWAYTGFNFEEFILFKNNCKCDSRINIEMLELLKYVDVVVDGPFILSKRTLNKAFVGSSNQRLIDVKDSLKHNCVTEYRIGD